MATQDSIAPLALSRSASAGGGTDASVVGALHVIASPADTENASKAILDEFDKEDLQTTGLVIRFKNVVKEATRIDGRASSILRGLYAISQAPAPFQKSFRCYVAPSNAAIELSVAGIAARLIAEYITPATLAELLAPYIADDEPASAMPPAMPMSRTASAMPMSRTASASVDASMFTSSTGVPMGATMPASSPGCDDDAVFVPALSKTMPSDE